MKRIATVAAIFFGLTMSVLGDNWPAWRGPDGQGRSAEKNLPLTWSDTENVKWKVPLPAGCNSTPIIWGDKVFLTQMSKDRSVRSLWCLARQDGKLLWQKDVSYSDKETTHGTNPYCSASPVTDGERIVVSHGSAGLFCYDLAGKELWKRDLGKFEHIWGNAASPILHGDLAILWCGPGERQFLLAVNKNTGKTVWQHDEPGGLFGKTTADWVGSWSTPLVVKIGEKDQLLLSVPNKFKAFEPNSGKELWSSDGGLGKLVYTSPLFADGIAVSLGGPSGQVAVKVGGSGNVTKDSFNFAKGSNWRVGSGVIVGDHVYHMEGNGLPRCWELKTGKDVWNAPERPTTAGCWGSMVYAAGRLYVTDQNGDTCVFAASPKYELLATNRLGKGERVNASIAISGGDLYIRTYKHLWCISDKKQKNDSTALPAAEATKPVTVKDGDRILFLGDSLTWYGGRDEPKKHVTKGYVRIVEETLQKKHKNVEVHWASTGGGTVQTLISLLDKQVLPKKPTIVVIQIGCNDARGSTKEKFETGLEQLIDRLHKEKIQVIQCTCTSVGEKHDGTNPADKNLEIFAKVAREVAQRKKVPLNDLRVAFVEHWKKNNPDNKSSGILTYDGNHFNQAGMEFVAQHMLRMFK